MRNALRIRTTLTAFAMETSTGEVPVDEAAAVPGRTPRYKRGCHGLGQVAVYV